MPSSEQPYWPIPNLPYLAACTKTTTSCAYTVEGGYAHAAVMSAVSGGIADLKLARNWSVFCRSRAFSCSARRTAADALHPLQHAEIARASSAGVIAEPPDSDPSSASRICAEHNVRKRGVRPPSPYVQEASSCIRHTLGEARICQPDT